jgi:hypothetical protein
MCTYYIHGLPCRMSAIWRHRGTLVTLAPCLHAMPTELPYAADAEVSLSYDELQVRISL